MNVERKNCACERHPRLRIAICTGAALREEMPRNQRRDSTEPNDGVGTPVKSVASLAGRQPISGTSLSLFIKSFVSCMVERVV